MKFSPPHRDTHNDGQSLNWKLHQQVYALYYYRTIQAQQFYKLVYMDRLNEFRLKCLNQMIFLQSSTGDVSNPQKASMNQATYLQSEKTEHNAATRPPEHDEYHRAMEKGLVSEHSTKDSKDEGLGHTLPKKIDHETLTLRKELENTKAVVKQLEKKYPELLKELATQSRTGLEGVRSPGGEEVEITGAQPVMQPTYTKHGIKRRRNQ